MIIKFILFLVACLSLGYVNSVRGSSRDTKRFSRKITGKSLPDKTLSLTFDDGPSEKTTLDIGKYLYEQDIQATFFVIGDDVCGRESILKQLAEWGHLVANHSWSHSSMIKITPEQAIEEVTRTDKSIKAYKKEEISLFRAPYGDFNGKVARIFNKASLGNYIGSIHWDIGGRLKKGHAADWACWDQGVDVSDCALAYFKETEDRGKGIVLLHDWDLRTAQMIRILVPKWKAAGYKFTRVDNVPKIREKLNLPSS